LRPQPPWGGTLPHKALQLAGYAPQVRAMLYDFIVAEMMARFIFSEQTLF
jgi:hypothetical protein